MVEVSIHAPARGATTLEVRIWKKRNMFQFTRPRGARPTHAYAELKLNVVSIHAPARGATLPISDKDSVDFQVSIHAPARGATGRQPQRHERHGVSIHAPARGATRRHGAELHRRMVSIHAPARGATSGVSTPVTTPGFNSRAREGRDAYHGQGYGAVRHVSIHAPARGATID